MFYRYLKSKWEAGKVKIGLPALGAGDKVYIEAKGLTGIAASFLSAKEKQQLKDLARKDALRVSNDSCENGYS